MGKKKTKKFGSFRPSPIATLSDQVIAAQMYSSGDCTTDGGISASVANILDKLQSPSRDERGCGCQLLASLVSQPRAIEVILRENVVRVVSPLFLDTSREVRNSALGALRNMCVSGDDRVLDAMVASDILTPLLALIKEYESGWTSDAANCDVLVEALELLSNLCEGSGKAVKILNQENVLPLFLPHLKVGQWGYTLPIAVARLVHIVSENNPAVTGLLLGFVDMLLTIVAETPTGMDAVLLRTLVIGILLNLTGTDLSSHFQAMVKALVKVLEMDCLSLVLSTLQGQHTAEQASASSESGDTWPEVLRLVQAQGIALELLANFCCSQEDSGDAMDCDGWEDDNSGDEDSLDTEDMKESDSVSLSADVQAAFVECSLLSKVLAKAQPLDPAQTEELNKSQAGKNVLERLGDLQSRALLCASNVLTSLEGSSLGQADPSLPSVWASVYSLAKLAHESPSRGETYKWAVSDAMRATLQRLAQTDTAQFADVTEADIQFLLSFGTGCKNRETQVNIVRCISTVGCVLSEQNPPHPLLARVGQVLAGVACGSEDLLVVAEALDSLFDVFKEDHTDPVVQEVGLVDRLKALQPGFKSRIQKSRKSLGENLSIVLMAKANLAGYIKYKTTHR